MQRTIITLLLFPVLVYLTACSKVQGEEVQEKKTEPVVLVIAVDGTKSYRYLEKAKKTVIGVINNLPDNSRLFVRWITEDSASDRNSIVSALIPDAKKPRNPYDLKGRKEYKIKLATKIEAVKQINNMIAGARIPMAQRTDIYGAIYSAGERFIDAKERPLLILLTDMDDNTNLKDRYNINIKGTDVIVLDYQMNSVKGNGSKGYWTEYLKSVGADNVRFQHIDDPMVAGGF